MSPAGPVVVVDHRTHLHVIQSNAPKLIKLHSPFIYLSQASTFRHIKAFIGRPTKIFLYCLLETPLTAGTVPVRLFSIKSVLK